MGTSLDIKIKRANKVYHAGVSGVGRPADFVIASIPRTSGVPGRGRGAPPGESPSGASGARQAVLPRGPPPPKESPTCVGRVCGA